MRLALMILIVGCCPALQAQVTLTFLANEGVVIEGSEHKVMIDGFVQEPFALFGAIPEGYARQQDTATGVFEDIDLALASHQHFEHFQPDPACRFFQSSPATRMATVPQVLVVFRERCKTVPGLRQRLDSVVLDAGEARVIPLGSNGDQVTLVALSHGTRKYARLEHLAHLVELDGIRILHLGDAALIAENFAALGMENWNLDVALVPYMYFQRKRGREILRRHVHARQLIAVHIPPREAEQFVFELTQTHPEVRAFVQPMEAIVVEPVDAVPAE